ncbi:uncharacterized protein METZ01_LOCUS501911, partial [marine metagenome]
MGASQNDDTTSAADAARIVAMACDGGDEALIDGLVAIGHPLTPGYSHPEYPFE